MNRHHHNYIAKIDMTRIWQTKCHDYNVSIILATTKAMKLSETFCQRLLHQTRLVDPNGFICNANFSFMKIRAAINVFVIPSHPICHHCAVCMWVMTPKHPIIYAALAYGHSWCREWHYFKLGWFFGHWRLSAGIIINSVWLKHRRHQGYNGWKAS